MAARRLAAPGIDHDLPASFRRAHHRRLSTAARRHLLVPRGRFRRGIVARGRMRLRAVLQGTWRARGPINLQVRARRTCVDVLWGSDSRPGCPSSGRVDHQPHLLAYAAAQACLLRQNVSQSGCDAQGRLRQPDRLALQKQARERGYSVFVDATCPPVSVAGRCGGRGG